MSTEDRDLETAEQLTEDLGLEEPQETDGEPERVEDQPDTAEEQLPEGEGEETALEEVEPDKPKRTDVVPLKTFKEEQRKHREAKARLAQFEALQQIGEAPAELAQAKEPEKSPLETWVDTNAERLKEEPELSPPAAIIVQETRWQREQAQRAADQNTAQGQHNTMVRSIAVAKATFNADARGEGLDFDTVVQAGAGQLTESDKAMIRVAGDQAGEEIYDRCLRRARQPGSPSADEINAAVRAHRQSRWANPTAPNPQQNRPKPKGGKEPPTREQVLRRPQQPQRLHERLGIEFPSYEESAGKA